VYGFPNNKNEDPIRKFLLPNEEKIMEERRLFYVALTRTKNKVYIVSNKKNESKFVKEIIKEKNVVVKNMKKHNIK
jgi:DNA helicase-4